MASVMKEFFSNDIVYRFDKHKRICLGVVIDSYEDDNQDSLQKGECPLRSMKLQFLLLILFVYLVNYECITQNNGKGCVKVWSTVKRFVKTSNQNLYVSYVVDGISCCVFLSFPMYSPCGRCRLPLVSYSTKINSRNTSCSFFDHPLSCLSIILAEVI